MTRDGRVLIFAADRLYARDLAAFEPTPIAGTEGATTPSVSPDGRWVAFFASGKIKKVALSGGDPTTLAETSPSMPGAAWGPDNTIMFSRSWATGLSSVPADGGEIRELTHPDQTRGERGHWRPSLLPDGQHVLFTIWMAGTGVNDARIGLLDLKTKQHRALFPGTNGIYLRSGHILFFHAGAWRVVPFDATAGQTTGEPVTVLDDAFGVAPDGGESYQPLAVSDTGTLVYRAGPVRPTAELIWADRTGRFEPLGLPPRMLDDAALSPDGRRIAVTRMEAGTYELWIDDIARKSEERLDIKGTNFSAVWHPGGSSLAFVSLRKGEYDTYSATADGGDVQPVLTKDFDEQPVAWTHDGRALIYKEWRLDGASPMSLIDLAAGPNAQPQVVIPKSADGESTARLRRDDRWVLFVNIVAGRREVYVQRFPAKAPAVRVSRNGGVRPRWSPSGDEIVFQQAGQVWTASFREEGERAIIGEETRLFSLPPASVLYDVAPDGRFLIGRPAGVVSPNLRVVINWFDELKKTDSIK